MFSRFIVCSAGSTEQVAHLEALHASMTRFKHFSPAVMLVVIVCIQACQRPTESHPSHQQRTSSNVFDAYLKTDITLADGFDFPLGDANAGGLYKDVATGIEYSGWRIATHFAENYQLGMHTGEDWNGNGGGNTDLGQDVHAVANGRVTFAQNCGRLWGNVITIEHHSTKTTSTARSFHFTPT